MSVAYDAFNAGTSGTGNLSWTHTPVGVPNAIVVPVVSIGSTNPTKAATYGGVAMEKVQRTPLMKASGEVGAVDVWFLGAGIPTGPQTVSITADDVVNNKTAWSRSLSGDGDMEVIDTSLISSDSFVNPGVTVSLFGRQAVVLIAFLSGQDDPTGIAPQTGWTQDAEVDLGTVTAGFYRYNTISTADVIAEYVAAAEDVVAIGLAVGRKIPETSPLLAERWQGPPFQRNAGQFFDAPAGIVVAPTSGIGNPPFWGGAYGVDTHGNALRAFQAYHFGNERVKTAAHEFTLTAESIADGGFLNFFSGKHDGYPNDLGANDLIWRFQLGQTAGSLVLIGFVNFDGTNQIVISTFPIVIGTRYLLEVEWNLTAATWQVWINNVSQASGTISGTALNHPWELTDVQPGGAAIDTAVGTHSMGPVLVYDSARSATKWASVFGDPLAGNSFGGI